MFLALKPLSQASQVNVLHRAGATARVYQQVIGFLFGKADAADLLIFLKTLARGVPHCHRVFEPQFLLFLIQNFFIYFENPIIKPWDSVISAKLHQLFIYHVSFTYDQAGAVLVLVGGHCSESIPSVCIIRFSDICHVYNQFLHSESDSSKLYNIIFDYSGSIPSFRSW
jgi:hypothetical protein